MSFVQAMRSKVFWILMPSILPYALNANITIADLSAILIGYGVASHSAATALSVQGHPGLWAGT
jgi:hypothetical protein